MLPLKLILKGLYSYQEEQIIDFTKLTDAKLFGIFGAVGSGKSSILEAISFALYGETERLNLRDNRAYNMMNLKCGELFIDFTFLAGNPEGTYKSIVSCKRHKTIFEKVPSIERKAYKKINNEWIPIEHSEMEEAVGLSYQNFRRTIIIPQGKFSEFLQLGDKDRTEMLKEIFHLERFEYYRQVVSLEKKNNEKINILKGKLEQLGEISPDEIEDQKKIRHTILEDTSRLNGVLEEKIQEEQKLSHLKELFDKLFTLKKTLGELDNQKDFYASLEKKIKNYEHCLMHFKPLLDYKLEEEKKIKVAENDIKEFNRKISQAKDQLLLKQQEFVLVEKKFQEKDTLKIKQEELEKIISILSLEKEIEIIKERVLKGTVLLDNIQETIEKLTKEREKFKLSINQKKASLPDLGILKEINDWFIVKKNLDENIGIILSETSELQKSIEIINNPTSRSIPPDLLQLFSLDEKNKQPHDFIEILNLKKEEFYIKQENVSAQIENAAIHSKLESFASALKLDDPCPLCGSLHHPNIINIENVSFQLADLKTKKVELAEAYKKCEELITREQANIFKIENLNTQLNKQQKKLQAEKQKLDAHKEKFIWKTFDPNEPEKIELLYKAGEKIQKEVTQLEDSLDSLINSLEENQKNKDKYSQGLNQLNLSLGNKISEQSTYKNQLKHLNFIDFKDTQASFLKNEIEKIKEEYKTIIHQHELLSTAINSLNQEIAKTGGQLDETLKHQKEVLNEYETNNHTLKQKLSVSAFLTLEEVEKILSEKIDLEKENDNVLSYKNQLSLSLNQLREVEKETLNKEYKAENHQLLLKTIEEQKGLIAQANKEIGRLDNLITTLEENAKERTRILKEMEQLNFRKEDLNTLKQLFKGSGFVNYVSSVFLKNLCNAANERFYKLTRQKLRLELTENNNFQIRDFLNNGQVRSVKTLSGGQTFQASLSLALALAESVQQQNKSHQNFFFLDEGFGSQDKESLTIVFETLKSLRKENRIVGVISHIVEMQQEIDVYLNIVNNEETGSQVKGSWEG
ncbi:MAG TPA: AAA family ATPase [Cytophagales bacterium]|nr:AAA family ATPase [Cytophagales bacterium]